MTLLEVRAVLLLEESKRTLMDTYGHLWTLFEVRGVSLTEEYKRTLMDTYGQLYARILLFFA